MAESVNVDWRGPPSGGVHVIPLDPESLDALRALDPDGRTQLVRRVLQTYQGSLERLLAEFRSAHQAADWQLMSRVAHTLKSSSYSVGAQGLGQLCADFEHRVRQDDIAAAAALVDAFYLLSRDAGQAVAQALHTEAGAPGAAPAARAGGPR